MLPDYSKAIYMHPSDKDFAVIFELFSWYAIYKNPHVWYNMKDLPQETCLSDIDGLDTILEDYFNTQT